MTPGFTMNDAKNIGGSHAVLSGESACAHSLIARDILFADETDLCLSQFRKSLLFASRIGFWETLDSTRVGPHHSSLARRICHVVGLRTEPKMVRIDTDSIIAPVENTETRRNSSVFDYPRDTMCEESLASNLKTSITVTSARCPDPTFLGGRFPKFVPKPFDVLQSEGRDDTGYAGHVPILKGLMA